MKQKEICKLQISFCFIDTDSELSFVDSVTRAYLSAAATVDTCVGIDYIDRVAC